MGIDRREFIRIAGLSTLLGLGGTGAFELLAPGRVEAEIVPAPGSMRAKRWAMVINQKKLDDNTAQQCAAAAAELSRQAERQMRAVEELHTLVAGQTRNSPNASGHDDPTPNTSAPAPAAARRKPPTVPTPDAPGRSRARETAPRNMA